MQMPYNFTPKPLGVNLTAKKSTSLGENIPPVMENYLHENGSTSMSS